MVRFERDDQTEEENDAILMVLIYTIQDCSCGRNVIKKR